jgi:hypothetical protein
MSKWLQKNLEFLDLVMWGAPFSTIGPHRESKQEPTFIFEVKNSFGNVYSVWFS